MAVMAALDVVLVVVHGFVVAHPEVVVEWDPWQEPVAAFGTGTSNRSLPLAP